MREIKLYRERRGLEEILTKKIFKTFVDHTGHGDPKDLYEILLGRYVVDDFAYSDDYQYFTVISYFENVVVPHKIAVWDAGREIWEMVYTIGLPESDFVDNLYIHDLSKFSAEESFGYALHDFKSNWPSYSFDLAWQHHKLHNPHHPQYWLSVNQSGEVKPLDMNRIYVIEMLADWMGASKIYGGEMQAWLGKNLSKFLWTPKTELHVLSILKQSNIHQSPELLTKEK